MNTKKSNVLRPCPFCGGTNCGVRAGTDEIWCVCGGHSPHGWNSRPIENKLRTENEKLRVVLKYLFEACMLADFQGELSELISGELLDSVGTLLGYTPENAEKADKELEMAILKALNEVTK